MEEALSKRRAVVFDKIKANPKYLFYLVLALIAWFGYYVRTRNLGLLKDATTGQYIPIALDPHVVLRYVNYIIDNGSLMSVDTLRYYPLGFTGLNEFSILTYTIAYFYKILHFLNSSITVGYAHVIYPAVAFVIGLVVFFFLMKKIFDWKVALVSSAFLTVLPAYLYRTMSGFSDKEALAMIFMYLGLLLFYSMFKEKKFKMGLFYAVSSGVTIALLWLVWGGAGFAMLTIGAFAILLVLLERMDKQKLYLYSIYMFVFLLSYRLGFPERAGFSTLVTNYFSGIMILGLVLGWFNYLVFDKDLLKIKSKVNYPYPFVSLGIIGVFGIIMLRILNGVNYFSSTLSYIFTLLTSPQNFDRWALTVAESQQPYFTDILSNFGWWFLILIFVGALFMFYETFKSFGKKKIYEMTAVFGLFIIAFSMSRYSSGSNIFDGVSGVSILVYLGSLIGFIIYMGYNMYQFYQHSEDKKNVFSKIKLGHLLVLLFFVFTLLGARSAIRLLFTFAPATAMLAGFGVMATVGYLMKFKEKYLRIVTILALIIVVGFLLNNFGQSVLSQAQYTGLSYNQQWQVGMEWVRENTPEDAVFAHWWDYGYWVQTGGERATLSDGGNARGAINHFIGRHLLTAYSEREALELLAANNATHVLMISDEIGKYGAFSSIGADVNYDRFSNIPMFSFDESQTHESRNGTNLVFTGGAVLDSDFIINDQFIAAYSTGIGAFIIPIELDENNIIKTVSQPMAYLAINGQGVAVPMTCVFIDGKEYTFDEGEGVLDACVQVIPSMSGGQLNQIGAALYLGPRVYPTLFTRLYLFGSDSDYFTEVYTDEAGVPLMFYEGRMIGPLKIWEVSYPDDLVIPEEYYGIIMPEGVSEVKDF